MIIARMIASALFEFGRLRRPGQRVRSARQRLRHYCPASAIATWRRSGVLNSPELIVLRSSRSTCRMPLWALSDGAIEITSGLGLADGLRMSASKKRASGAPLSLNRYLVHRVAPIGSPGSDQWDLVLD